MRASTNTLGLIIQPVLNTSLSYRILIPMVGDWESCEFYYLVYHRIQMDTKLKPICFPRINLGWVLLEGVNSPPFVFQYSSFCARNLNRIICLTESTQVRGLGFYRRLGVWGAGVVVRKFRLGPTELQYWCRPQILRLPPIRRLLR